jgi:hypothetical protein
MSAIASYQLLKTIFFVSQAVNDASNVDANGACPMEH